MSLHADLLEQAKHLALRESKKPRQASLRRAVSTAYYALFHMLLYEATLSLFANKPPTLRQRAGRAFAHGEVRTVCAIFSRADGGIKDLSSNPLSPALNDVAQAFVALYEARHKADYDLTETFDRVQVVGYIDQVEDAMLKWKAIKNTPDANVFLAALLVHSKWNKYK